MTSEALRKILVAGAAVAALSIVGCAKKAPDAAASDAASEATAAASDAAAAASDASVAASSAAMAASSAAGAMSAAPASK
ncbi:MAG TPA: hypothetical protein VHY32_04795 [Caulobacteraceae bacterium]|jgi:hypothetical protein|nr:hypothetical protein [Caulobacteraceae bacterium]